MCFIFEETKKTEIMNESNCETLGTPPRGTPIDSNKIRDILIRQLDYGYTVLIGCQSFAIETKEKLLLNITDYLNSPQEIEKLWLSEKKLK